jgi:hypothetical protein
LAPLKSRRHVIDITPQHKPESFTLRLVCRKLKFGIFGEYGSLSMSAGMTYVPQNTFNFFQVPLSQGTCKRSTFGMKTFKSPEILITIDDETSTGE